ncbi:MAG: FumA C-terminus/TtdB family hydratase beta subunit [Eubacteriales bacterium]|nr:FumA C-terminus/TtdB family hydratase beta subunit [Eubacteriales bacterium]
MKDLSALKAGESILYSGTVYTARDQAHKRMVEALTHGKKLPFDVRGQIIYYCGPTRTRPGRVTGSCGPTTSSRMDTFTPALLQAGLTGMIGKGARSAQVVSAIKKHKAVYFVALAGCGALLSTLVKKAAVVAYEDLGPEAIYKLEVENFPLIVAVDSRGRSIF